MKCVIIDDEPLAIRVLTNHVEKTRGLTLVKSFENAFEALYFVQTQSVDLIFLDIEMPGVNGIQFINILKYPPRIIITSAYQEYALEALQAGVIDYLLKPVAYDRFLNAVSKALESALENPVRSTATETFTKDRIFYLKEGKTYNRISESEILFLHGDRNYCQVYLSDRKVTITGNLAFCTSRLDRQQFKRIHRSYVVALSHISRFNADSVWIQDHEIPIGRTYKRALMTYLDQLKF